SVDSTNNYAMGQVHEGLAKHGIAWFANVQTAGKGQRGKVWQSNPGENILLSVVVDPAPVPAPPSFIFTAGIALKCIDFLHALTGKEFQIKWPNDIYFNDRKAGGILIENVIQGNYWKWAIIGIGINVNQVHFKPDLINPVSLKNITGHTYITVDLARQLHSLIVENVSGISPFNSEEIIKKYNLLLYKKNDQVQLKKGNSVFTTTINGVDKFGNLLTSDVIGRSYAVGEIEWVIA
ncbi:MAG: biotin--[acetyl-CoA-carboxylase] ligase, partial [Ferruginibacter sp.]